MVAHAYDTRQTEDVGSIDLTPTQDGGFYADLTGDFPLTCIEVLRPADNRPLRILIPHEGSKVTVALSFEDRDQDGIIERGTDVAVIRPEQVHAGDGVALDFDAQDREAVARVVVRKLGGKPGRTL
jgi:hypothetical protein